VEVRIAVCTILVASLVAGSAENGALGQEAHQPVFEAFKTYCVDADFDPQAEAVDVETRGGKPHNPHTGSTSFDRQFPMTVTMWDITVQGQPLILTFGTSREPFGKDELVDQTNCIILSFAGDAASANAIRAWVGSERFAQASRSFEHFEFKNTNGVHSAISDEAARKAALKSGQLWELELVPDGGYVMLTHDGIPYPKVKIDPKH
jgi:hypothetical protein